MRRFFLSLTRHGLIQRVEFLEQAEPVRHFDSDVVGLGAFRRAHATAHVAQDQEAVRFHLYGCISGYRCVRSQPDAMAGEIFKGGLDPASTFASKDFQRCVLMCRGSGLAAAFH